MPKSTLILAIGRPRPAAKLKKKPPRDQSANTTRYWTSMARSEQPIITTTSDYERWLKKHVAVVETDVQQRHKEMAPSLFAFLRATFYRWAALWSEVCPDLHKTPRVLAVGDLHVENFGTWRDAEGRLVWGVNDFDEVARMPYAVDLVRLVTSAILAERENRLSINAADAATAVLQGYTEFLQA